MAPASGGGNTQPAGLSRRVRLALVISWPLRETVRATVLHSTGRRPWKICTAGKLVTCRSCSAVWAPRGRDRQTNAAEITGTGKTDHFSNQSTTSSWSEKPANARASPAVHSAFFSTVGLGIGQWRAPGFYEFLLRKSRRGLCPHP